MRSPLTQLPSFYRPERADEGSAQGRPKLDARAVQRGEIGRLRALRVKVAELGPARGRAVVERFAREFVDPERTGAYLEAIRRAGEHDIGIDHDRWLRPDCTAPESGRGCLQWLTRGVRGARCVRFDRRARLPVVEIAIDTMQDAWAASWPGLFICFDAARALAVSLDYEVSGCDLRAMRSTPYR
jgi:hypothetical protein